MCRLLAYTGEPVFLDTLLIEPEGSLISQARAAREARTIVNGDGCGLGWYGERSEPGLYRGVLPAWSDANLVSLCHQIRSRLFLAHVRAATAGSVSTANCHPFANGSLVFAHNGQIGAYGRQRRQVEAMIPDALYPSRAGTSDSEAIFLAAIGAGLADDPIGALHRTLSEILALGELAGEGDALRFAAILSDGTDLHAFRWASDGAPPSLYFREAEAGLLIASEPCGTADGEWTSVPPASVLTVTATGDARLRRFDPVAPRAASRRKVA